MATFPSTFHPDAEVSVVPEGKLTFTFNSTGFTNGVNGDIVGTFAAPIDPRLGPLAKNGGPTRTHALLPDSPAIDRFREMELTSQK